MPWSWSILALKLSLILGAVLLRSLLSTHPSHIPCHWNRWPSKPPLWRLAPNFLHLRALRRPWRSGRKPILIIHSLGIWTFKRSKLYFAEVSQVKIWLLSFGKILEPGDVVMSYTWSVHFEFALLESRGVSDGAQLRGRRLWIINTILAVTYRELRFITDRKR